MLQENPSREVELSRLFCFGNELLIIGVIFALQSVATLGK